MSKVFIVLTTVLAIALSVLFISTVAQWQDYKSLAEKLQEERNAALVELANARTVSAQSLAQKESELRRLRDELAGAQETARQRSDQYASARAELATAQNEKVAAEADRTKLQELLSVQTAELKNVQKQNDTLLSENLALQTRNAALNERNLDLTTELTIANDQLRNIQEKLYLCEQQNVRLQERLVQGGGGGDQAGTGGGQAAMTGAGGGETTQPPVKGEINAEVISVDGNYASINAGSSSGVVRGMTFMVWREGAGYLGDLVVETVRPNQAGGKLTTQVSGEIRSGDQVSWEPRGTVN